MVRATLLTLAPFPTRSGPCDPVLRPGFLSWGCPKIAPPSFKPGSASPRRPARRVSAASRPPFEMGMPVPIRAPSSWFLATSTVSSSSTLRPFSGRCRSWGSSRFSPPRSGSPRNVPTALRSFSSADSYVDAETNLRVLVGPCHPRNRLRPLGSPRTLPPRPFSSSEGSRDPEAFLRLRVRCPRCRCQPRAPGAPMGLSDPFQPAANHVLELSA